MSLFGENNELLKQMTYDWKYRNWSKNKNLIISFLEENSIEYTPLTEYAYEVRFIYEENHYIAIFKAGKIRKAGTNVWNKFNKSYLNNNFRKKNKL